ncbi:MAG: NADH-quinone oxidoreductase subunit NuoN [Gammaproteobacteria bacterium]
MNLTATHILALAPLIVVVLTTVVVMLSVAWRRHHFLNATLTVLGLNAALLATVFARSQIPDALQVTELVVFDHMSVFGSIAVLISTLGCATLFHAYLEGLKDNREEMYLLLLCGASGALVLVGATHMASFFIGLELMSVPLYGMIGYIIRDRRSLEASVKYLVLSGAASVFLLFGMALVYAATGTLAFGPLAAHADSELVAIGIAMILIAIGFKLSLVPFHLWTPDVYHGAPAPVGAFLATVSKIAVVVVLLRWWQASGLGEMAVHWNLLAVLAAASIIGGNLLALLQNNLKRLLGYSSIAHFGFLLAAVIAGNAFSQEAIFVYLLTYMAATLSAFGVATLLSSPYRGDDAQTLGDLRGLFWQRPFLSAVMTVSLLSLGGVPLTAGFIAKFYVIASTVSSELWWLAAVLVAGSAIGIFYYLRVMVSMFLAIPGRRRLDAERDWGQRSGGVMTLALALFTIAAGLYPQPLLDLLR